MQRDTANLENKRTDQKKQKNATVFVTTFPPTNKSGSIGHSVATVCDSNSDNCFTRNFYPSNDPDTQALFRKTYGYAPVEGSLPPLEKTARDSKPISIQKIEGLNLDAMQAENEQFEKKVVDGTHLFSIANTSLNPLNHIVKRTNREKEDRTTHETNNTSPIFALSDPLYSLAAEPLTQSTESLTMGNCTDAVERLLVAGGYQKPSSYASWLPFFRSRPKPLELQQELRKAGAKEVLHTNEVPATIQDALKKGEEFAAKHPRKTSHGQPVSSNNNHDENSLLVGPSQ